MPRTHAESRSRDARTQQPAAASGVPARPRRRGEPAPAKAPLPAVAKLALSLVLPLAGLFVVALFLQSGTYRLNTERFADLLLRSTILALAAGVALTMFVAAFGRDSDGLPAIVKVGALALATAALVLGLLFGVLL